MHYHISKNTILFALFLSATIFIHPAMAVDSTSVASANTASFKTSYVLYQSPLSYFDDQYNIKTRTMTPDKKYVCETGYAACISIQAVNSNDLNFSQCGIRGFFRRGKIYRLPEGGYNIEFKYGYTTHTYTGSHCWDRGGVFSYTITCIPEANINPDTKSVKNGVGPICVS